MFFEGGKNRKLRDEGTQKGEQVNSALVEFTMNALLNLMDRGEHDALRYLYEAAKRGAKAEALPAFLPVEDAGLLPAGGATTMDITGTNALLDDDNRHLRQDAYPIILAALVPQENQFRIRNPLDLHDTDTQLLETLTAGARQRGFNAVGTWRDRLDPEPDLPAQG